MAGNTPFRYFKQSEHRGGQHDALVVHWPNGIKAKGEVRSQYHHISDIAPTILEARKFEVPEDLPRHQTAADGWRVHDVLVQRRQSAECARSVQYYEMFGNRAIWVDGWKAVTLHANRMPWELGVGLTVRQTTSGSSTTWPRTSPRAPTSRTSTPRSSRS